MCTVTYIPNHDSGYILTSNRDENVNRAKALSPELTQFSNAAAIFPKDSSKGGTWVGCTDKGRTLCLLNGAFIKHTPKNNYTKSRGLIVLDFFNANDISLFTKSYSLKGIEPFTLIIIDEGEVLSLTELKWDGNEKFITSLKTTESYIWSSVTLYNSEQANSKKEKFKAFVTQSRTKEEIFNFHKNGTTNEPLLMKYINDKSPIETISITQVDCTLSNSTLTYTSLLEKSTTSQTIQNTIIETA